MKKNIITFGEIMLRLATKDFQKFSQTTQFNATFGGGEANVAVSLSNLGIPTEFVSGIPGNDIGDSCIKELRKHGVGTKYIYRCGERLGIYYLETGAASRPSKIIYDRSYSSFSQLKKGMIDWDEVFKEAKWFHWTGITPAISKNSADLCLEAIETARRKNIIVSCDLNYRSKLWNYGKKANEIMPELVAGCDIILGNEEDAERTLGIVPKGVNVKSGNIDKKAYLSVSEQIMKQYPEAKKVITTLRGSISASHNTWSGVLYDGKRFLTTQEYNITNIVDRIGGGDAFMAGLIYGLITYQDDQKTLDFATAASCLKHSIQGDFNLATVEEVEKLMEGDKSGRVSR